MNTRTLVAVALIPLSLGAARVGLGQNPEDSAAGESARAADGRLLKMFLDHATTQLDLDGGQRDGLRRVLLETFGRRALLAREGRELRRDIRAALSDPASRDETFRRLSAASLDLKRRELELLDWQRDRVAEVLTPRQTLRFLIMQEQLARRIEALRSARERR